MASNIGPLLTLHNPAAARRYYEAGLWRPETFCDLLEKHASERPHAFAIRDSERRLTWAEFKELVDRISGHLAASGVGLGDRIGLRLSNRVEGVAALLAASRIGCVANPSLHHNYTADEVVSLIEALSARVILAEDGVGVDAATVDLSAKAAAVPGVSAVFQLPAGRASAGVLDAAVAIPEKQDDPDAVCYLAFTSGTTGRPKGVMHSANTLLANARDMVRDWGHDESTVLLSLSPLTHHIAWVAVSQVLASGGELALNDPPAGMKPLDWLLETKATYVMGVPTHAMDILADQQARDLATLGSVRTFYMAGAPIPPAVAEGFRTQGVLPQNVYGMTENSSHQYTVPNDPDSVIVTSCGRGGPAYTIRIVDQEDPDKDVAPGEVGQIAGQGACLMLGYFGNQEATEASFNKAGQFLSGDLGRLDVGGNLVVAGRLKDIIIRGGHNIHPTRIEDIAVAHPAIAKAAAFPAPDERLGEKVCLAVILAEGAAAPSDSAILQHLNDGGLSRYDMPEYFIVMEAFPLTASGKILKRELAADLIAGKFTPAPCRFAA
jgi:acyl-CoA synthetase